MKRCILFVFIMSCLVLNVYGLGDSKDQIYIEHTKGSDNHNQYIPDDEPRVYYDNEIQAIIIEGNGAASCYHVKIYSLTTSVLVLSTDVSGNYAVIDMARLYGDDYILYISTPMGNTYTLTLSLNNRHSRRF